MALPPLLLVRRARPVGEPPEAAAALAGGRRTFVAPLVGGRLADLLERVAPGLVHPVRPVTHWLPDLDAGPERIAATEPGGPFAAVALGSHLVNTPDAGLRAALLAAVARHLAAGGTALVEHHPLDWLATAAESWSERDGTRVGMVDVRVDPPFVSAISVYEAGAEVVRQPFTARVLSDAELAAALATAGLAVRRRRSPTWLEVAVAGALS